ncbi:hypothetical protein PCASD_22138 [Puccinia coronata f. sp. avenae]|uniref:Uncharacterized protein n=1 Tax=Puccinia coronata f. sp. avenae TaxID=200324 RepID=A0A2N5TNT5_9BASI|nr:hypothetical protein PCASD_22138 [Puccinia coronata f. sp. avenae]
MAIVSIAKQLIHSRAVFVLLCVATTQTHQLSKLDLLLTSLVPSPSMTALSHQAWNGFNNTFILGKAVCVAPCISGTMSSSLTASTSSRTRTVTSHKQVESAVEPKGGQAMGDIVYMDELGPLHPVERLTLDKTGKCGALLGQKIHYQFNLVDLGKIE